MLTKKSIYLFLEIFFYKCVRRVKKFIKSLDVSFEKESISHEEIQESIIEEDLKTVVLFGRLQREIDKMESEVS
ncbi:hypothetical protein [Tenacibaculum sp. 190524A05c]|uniref:hypothetical protein n=1 Tax=Tenacibaculum platacis TaxID=3137852 RepID=UPI0031FB4BB5